MKIVGIGNGTNPFKYRFSNSSTSIYNNYLTNLMGNKPLVSVLMTSYNREKYLGIAVQSVLASTFTDFELIIVDDGSTDQTFSIAKDFASKDPRIKVFQNEINLGDYPNRNKAASFANGKYIKYLDSDDYIYPWGLKVLVETMEAYPQAGWGLCSMEPNVKHVFPIILSPKEAYEYHYLGSGLFNRAPLSSIIKKEVFDEVGGFKKIRMAGDFEMWHRLGQKHNVVLMPQGMVWYRSHSSQELNDYEQFVHVYAKIRADYLTSPDCPLDVEIVKSVIKKSKKLMIRNLFVGLAKMDYKRITTNITNYNIFPRTIG